MDVRDQGLGEVRALLPRKLHTAGLARIRALLDVIDADGRPLALACFETDPAECHRGPLGFAGWWEKQTGERVPDLAVLRCANGAAALVYEAEPVSNVGLSNPASGQNPNIGPDTQKQLICKRNASATFGRMRPDAPARLQLAAEAL